ncbi:hypothetical protein [Kribbella endophytica]
MLRRGRRGWRWATRVAAVLVIAGLALYLYSVGLETADKLASALGLLVALSALLVSVLSRPRPDETPVPKQRIRAATEFSYLEYVRQITPVELRGRETELDQLRAFCTGDGFYWRWTAGPWSGKSALLAWFVLHPPPGTEVVSFFVNGRFNPHHNRDAFIDALTEQLLELLDRPADPEASELSRVARLHSLIAEAASSCRFRGEQLVLVVDGLDEDRLLTPDQELFSIAALLPDKPLPGLKVVVAGRSDPPLPVDVPDRHPLRDPAVVHELSPSVHARASEQAATHELRTLLRDPLAQDVLGLITAAGGGLSEHDLSELTERSPYDVQALLTGSSGRTFGRQPAAWRRESTPDIYGFAHEELRIATTGSLGPAVLRASSDRLDQWAERYRAAGWPDHTPEYLLRGYLGKLLEAGDLPAAVALAVDSARHDLMLARVGVHHAALLEIRSVAAALTAQETVDLASVALLAFHRNEIEQHTSNVPTELPGLWARMGDFDKAESLADSITYRWSRESARTELLDIAAEQGDVARLESAAEQAESKTVRDHAVQLLRTLRATDVPPDAVSGTDTAAAQGPADQNPLSRVRALAERADRAGDLEGRELAQQAVALAETVEVAERPRAFIAVLRSSVVQADPAWTGDLLARAAQAALQITSPPDRVWALTEVSRQARRSGTAEHVARLYAAIDAEIALMRGRRTRRAAVEEFAEQLGYWGEPDRAHELLARESSLYDEEHVGVRLTSVRVWLAAGDLRRADEVAAQITDLGQRSRARLRVVRTYCEAGQLPAALATYSLIPEPSFRLSLMPTLVTAAIAAGSPDQAAELLAEGELVGAEVVSVSMWALAGSRNDLCRLAGSALDLGNRPQAVRLAELAVAPGNSFDFQDVVSSGLAELARRLVAIEALDRAERVNARISSAFQRVVTRFVRTGDADDDRPIAVRRRDAAALGPALDPLVARAEAGHPQEAAAAAWEVCASSQPVFGTAADRPMVAALAAIGAAGGWPELLRLVDRSAGFVVGPTVIARLTEATIRGGDEAGAAVLSGWLEERAPEMLRAVVAAVRTETDPAAGTALLDELVRDIRGIESGFRRDLSLRRMQETLLFAGAYDQAERLLSAFDDELERSDALGVVAAAEAIAGLDERWENLVASGDPDRCEQHRRAVATAVAEAGDHRRAVAILRGSDDPFLGPAYLATVRSAVDNGDLDFAEEMLTEPEHIGVTARDLSTLAAVQGWCALAKAGEAAGDHRAQAWARSAEELVEGPAGEDERLKGRLALAEIAPPAQARVLLARAFGVGNWWAPLDLVSRHDPRALACLADALIERLPEIELG